MNNKSLTYTGIVALIVGVALIFLRATALDVVVMVMGVGFLIAAALNLIVVFSHSTRTEFETDGKKKTKAAISVGSLFTAIGAAALGLWMLLAPGSFSDVIVYVFIALIILAGIYHVCLLAFGFNGVRFPFGFFILPILLIIAGVVLLIIGAEVIKASIVLIMGIALVVYALCNFIETAGESSYRK